MPALKLSIIIPVYNEAGTILQVLERVQAVDIDKEVIIVDDGSMDGTRTLLDEISHPGVLIIMQSKNGGKGSAIQTGIARATGQYSVVHDADMEYDPQDLHRLLETLESGMAEVVYGSRFMNPQSRQSFLPTSYVANKVLTFTTNLLYRTRLSDMETCYKMMATPTFQEIRIRSKRFDCEPEVTAKLLKRGKRIHEVPISYCGRGFHEGKHINWKDGVVALWMLIKYRVID